jgi:secreted trypsin-like serine protease
MRQKYCINKRSSIIFLVLLVAGILLITYFSFFQGLLNSQTSTSAKAASRKVTKKITTSPITNGKKAGEFEYPYFARIEASLYNIASGKIRKTEYCGGALISPQYILTAAHCVYGVFQQGGTVSITIGVVNYSGGFDGYYEGVVEQVKPRVEENIYLHKNFIYSETFRLSEKSYDLALIKLSTPAQNIPTLSIPDPLEFTSSSQYPEVTLRNQSAIFMGIGSTTNATGALSTSLMYASIPLKDGATYSKEDSRFIVNKPLGVFNWTNSKDSGICNGDSGGPVVIQNIAKLLYIGVITGSTSCEEKVSVATSVAYHARWILDTIKAHGDTLLPNSGTAFLGNYTATPKRPLAMNCTNSGALSNTSTEIECLKHSILCKWEMPQTFSANSNQQQINLNTRDGSLQGKCESK